MSSTAAVAVTSTTTMASNVRQHRRRRHRDIRRNASLDFETHHRRPLPQKPLQRRSVSFGELVTVHWHPTILGDNPSVRSGPPVALGWDLVASEKLPLERSATRASENNITHPSLRLSPGSRIGRLQKSGVSFLAMQNAIAEGKAIRSQREACRIPHNNSDDNSNTINNNRHNSRFYIFNNNNINFAQNRRRLSPQTRRNQQHPRQRTQPRGGLPGSPEISTSYRRRSSISPPASPDWPQLRFFEATSPTKDLSPPFVATRSSQLDPLRRAAKKLLSRKAILATAA